MAGGRRGSGTLELVRLIEETRASIPDPSPERVRWLRVQVLEAVMRDKKRRGAVAASLKVVALLLRSP